MTWRQPAKKWVAHASRSGRYFLVMTEQLPARAFGWSNMFAATRESDPREEGDPPPENAAPWRGSCATAA